MLGILKTFNTETIDIQTVLAQAVFFGYLEAVKQAVHLLNARFNQLKAKHPETDNFLPKANGLQLLDFYSDRLCGVS